MILDPLLAVITALGGAAFGAFRSQRLRYEKYGIGLTVSAIVTVLVLTKVIGLAVLVAVAFYGIGFGVGRLIRKPPRAGATLPPKTSSENRNQPPADDWTSFG